MDSRTSPQEACLPKLFNASHLDLNIHSSQSPQCRPLSFEPPIAGVEPLDGLNVPESGLPLILHCKICLRISTWYNPMEQKFERNPRLDVLPSLSISSHSTSSEPSSIGTEFFSSVVVPPSPDSLCAERVSTRLENRFFTSGARDDNTPVALSQKSAVSHCQATSRVQSWIGGGIEGVCSSCHSSINHLAAPRAATSMELPRSHQNDPMMTASQRDTDKFNSSFSGSHPPRHRTKLSPNLLSSFSHAQALGCPSESQPLRPTPQQPANGNASSLPKHPSLRSIRSVKTSSVDAQERPGSCDAQVLPYLPVKSILREADSVKSRPTSRTRKKTLPVMVSDLSTTDTSPGSTAKHELVASDSSDSFRQEVTHRGSNLRALLREAKIPQPESEDFIPSSRRHPTTVDKWQAAMIATPRDHLRQGDFSTWQLYGTVDTPFYQRMCGLSASATSLSGKDTLFSASLTSLRDSPYTESRSASPISDKLTSNDAVLLSRRPSRGRAATSGTLFNQPSSEFSPPSSDTGRYLPDPYTNESQEILSGSALTKPRHSPSNVSLIARIANIQPCASKIDKGLKRRPNTATGTTPSSTIAQSSPKPGPYGHSTPSPHSAASNSLLPSLFLAGSKAASAGSRVTNVSTYKRPATSTGSGTRAELTSSLSKNSIATRPLPAYKISAGKAPTPYAPTLTTIPGCPARNDISILVDDSHQNHRPVGPLEIRPPTNFLSESSNSSKVSPVSASPPSHTQSRHGSPVQLSQSVPNFLAKPRFPAPKRTALYAATPLAVTSDQLAASDLQDLSIDSSPWLRPQDYQSKSRNFVLSVLPRPTSSSFSPGQKLSIHLKLSNKAKVRKYTAIHILLIGNFSFDTCCPAPAHDFLRMNYLIYPNPSEEVKIISNSGDFSEWRLELSLPEYANCACAPGPLPLPSTGVYAATKVAYSLQLHADRKQLLATQESLSVKINVVTPAEARYQVTTQSLRTAARKGRIPFSGGYLGSIDELALSHQVYYQSTDRLRIGYQFELLLSPNSFLPTSVAEEVSKATKIQLNTLMRLQTKDPALKYVDHRSKVAIIPPGEKDGCMKWIIKGFLELKAVTQQMQAVKGTLESTPRTPRRRENTLGSRSMLSSSNGGSSMGGGLSSPLGSSTNHSLQQETERQARLNSSQLFLLANIDHCPSVLAKPVEISSLIGSELLSPCPLRKLGDEMMKRAVMTEKMKRVQEENSKNDP